MKNKFPKFLFVVALFFIFPVFSFADTYKISILPADPLTISPNTLSGQMTVQSQNENGEQSKTTEKVTLNFDSSSPTGQFFTVSGGDINKYKYISSGDINRNFSYKDSTEGTFTITVNAKGETTGKEWTATQQITVSSGSAATPGEVLSASDQSPSSESVSSGTESTTEKVSSLNSQLEIVAGNDRTTSPGSPIWFQATVKKNTTGTGPELNWSFGDGNVGVGPTVSHTYKYPGDYVVVLSSRAGDIFSISRLKVKVIKSDLSVKDGGEYLEVSNNGSSEVNLFNWKIENNGKGFVFQPNTIILPHSSIKLDKSLLLMKGFDNSLGISLKNCTGEEVFSVAPTKEVNSGEVSKTLSSIKEMALAVQSEIPKVEIKTEKPKEIIADLQQIATGTEIIYESPKTEGFLKRAWKFVAGLLD
jgi:hypothetical protein